MTVRAHCMFSTFDPATNAVITSATVNVYNPGTVTPISATIFDRLGNTLSNPLTSDATTGLIDFYLTVAQEVDIVVSKASFTTRTYSNVPVLDDSSLELTALLTTTGDMPYASSNNSPARLGIGSTNAILQVSGGVPSWTSNTFSSGVFGSWTPGVQQGGSSPTLTNTHSGYYQLGKLAIVTALIQFTGAGSSPNDITITNLPITGLSNFVGSQSCIGTFSYLRSGTKTYAGAVALTTSIDAKFLAAGDSTGGAFLGNTNGPAFAVANNDILSFTLVYEAA